MLIGWPDLFFMQAACAIWWRLLKRQRYNVDYKTNDIADVDYFGNDNYVDEDNDEIKDIIDEFNDNDVYSDSNDGQWWNPNLSSVSMNYLQQQNKDLNKNVLCIKLFSVFFTRVA